MPEADRVGSVAASFQLACAHLGARLLSRAEQPCFCANVLHVKECGAGTDSRTVVESP